MTSSFRIITFGFIFKMLSCPIPPIKHICTLYDCVPEMLCVRVNNVFIFKNKYSLKTRDTKREPTPQTTIAARFFTSGRGKTKKRV